MPGSLRQPGAVLYLLAALLILSAAILVLLDAAAAEAFVDEWGPSENATAALYGLVILALWRTRAGDPGFRLSAGCMMLVFALREMDAHKAFTGGSMSKSRYWLDPTVGLPEKLIAGTFVLLVLYAMYRLARRLPALKDACAARRPYAWSIVAGFALVPVTKVIDALPRWLRPVFPIDAWLESFPIMRVLEETLEMGIPLCFLLALTQYLAPARARAG